MEYCIGSASDIVEGKTLNNNNNDNYNKHLTLFVKDIHVRELMHAGNVE